MIISVLSREASKDKIIFLERLGNIYQVKGRVYFSKKTAVRFQKKTYQVPSVPTSINKFGKSIYHLEISSGKPVMYDKSKVKPIFTPTELDIFLFRKLVERFVKSFGATNIGQDFIMLIILFGFGLCLGFIIRGFI